MAVCFLKNFSQRKLASGTMPVLQELHWLPVWRHTDIKMAILIYLAADCQLTVVISCVVPTQEQASSNRLQQLWIEMFWCWRTESVEQPSSTYETNPSNL